MERRGKKGEARKGKGEGDDEEPGEGEGQKQMENPVQNNKQIITKIAPPTGQSAEQLSYTICVVFYIVFVTAYRRKIKIIVLVGDVRFITFDFHEHGMVYITSTRARPTPRTLRKHRRTKSKNKV